MLDADTLLNGRYRLAEPIGEGGMATVYRAMDTRLGRIVAIKVLHTQYSRDEAFLVRFQQEAEFAASLGSHPNIVAIYDVGHDDPYHYIVMEYVEGRNLKEFIQEHGQLPVDEALNIVRQIAWALDFAHKRGLVHRDVKPQNIIVTGDGVPKVTDFGIARSAAASQLTRTGMVIGTVHYFSPEQAQGQPAGPASDIYSLGIILYEMLTGHLPFDAETPIGVAMQQVHSDPPSPWTYRPDLPASVVGVVMRALEKDPVRRYHDAAEFAAALAAPADGAAPVGGTTTLSPIVIPTPQRTSLYQPVEPRQRTAYVEEPADVAMPAGVSPRPGNRLPWVAAALAALVALLLGGSVFAAHNGLIGASKATPTATPTVHPTARPRHHTPTSTPTRIPVYVPPIATNTPTPQPTPTPTAPAFTPTPTTMPTSRPRPTVPPPKPTPTVPEPTPTPTPPEVTPTPTAIG